MSNIICFYLNENNSAVFIRCANFKNIFKWFNIYRSFFSFTKLRNFNLFEFIKLDSASSKAAYELLSKPNHSNCVLLNHSIKMMIFRELIA